MKVSVDQINALLPQTQCRECKYDGCKPYAQAIADGEDTIDHCPPGGVETLIELAKLTDLNPAPFMETVKANTRPAQVAYIDESICIGCTKCIQACPVDAISGAGKVMHTIIGSECTGCELCIEPCPMDCIYLEPLSEQQYDKDMAKQRFEFREFRLERSAKELEAKRAKAKQLAEESREQAQARRKQSIQDILARAKKK